MNFERYAKAIAAFVISLITGPALLAGFGGEWFHILGAFLLSGPTAVLTALGVYSVANKTHGFNVNDIADSLIDAGLEAVGDK